MDFWVKVNYFVKRFFPNYIWDIPNSENKVFLTFDDGPTPEVTEWVLEQLKKYNAKATFFCLGNNIEKHPDIFQKVIEEGHIIANHTYDHPNGWKTSTENYLDNVKECAKSIELKTQNPQLFRPPYGKLKKSQSRAIRKMGYKVIMWDVLSRDYDPTVPREKCLDNVLKNVESGSIIVFHDSVKARPNMQYVLPKTLAFLKEKGFICAGID